MSSEENAATARRWYTEGWTGNFAMADDIFAPNIAINGNIVGPAGPKRNCANRLTGFPDLQVVIEEQVIADDKIVTRARWSGTHTGPYRGIAPPGKHVAVRDMSIWRFVDGRSVENWTVMDELGLMQQLGVLPPGVGNFQVPADSAETAK